MTSKNFNQRITALEESVRMRPAFGAKVIEQAHLPEGEKKILIQALRNRRVVISHEELDRLNTAVEALPAAERTRIHRATDAAMIVALSEADAGLL